MYILCNSFTFYSTNQMAVPMSFLLVNNVVQIDTSYYTSCIELVINVNLISIFYRSAHNKLSV